MNAGLRRALLPAAVAAATVAVTALPAAAAASVSVTRASNGAQVTVDAPLTSNDVLNIDGQIDARTSTTQMVVTPPGGSPQVVASASGGLMQGASMSYALNTACVSYQPQQSPCTGSNPAPNGTWTVQLQGGESASTQFALRIPPAQPQGVSASGSGSTVTVDWQANTEPDLTGYTVLDGSGQTLAADLAPNSVCSGGACTAQVSAPGVTSVEIEAQRSTCPGCSQTLSSTPSQPAQVVWSSSAPSGSGSSSGTSGTGGSGSTSGSTGTGSGSGSTGSGSGSTGTTGSGSTAGTTGGSATGSGSGSRKTGSGSATSGTGRTATAAPAPAAPGAAADAGALLAQLLPGPSAVNAPSVPSSGGGALPGEEEPTTWGTYGSTLGYGPQTVGQLVTVPDGAQPKLAAESGPVSWFGASGWRALAEALLLLLAAGHVAAWLRRAPAE